MLQKIEMSLKSIPVGIDREDLQQEADLAVWLSGAEGGSRLARIAIARQWSDIERIKHHRFAASRVGAVEVWGGGHREAVDTRTPERIAAAREMLRMLAKSKAGQVALQYIFSSHREQAGREFGIQERHVGRLLSVARRNLQEILSVGD